MTKIIEEQEELSFSENDSPELPPPDIIAYNELRSCADLFRMHTQGILLIQPEFQREIIWKPPAQTRFIDSLIKQLPIPSMCFSMDYKTLHWQVIDGLQRMATIIKFLSGENWTLSSLDDIDPKISGQQISTFFDKHSELNSYLVRIENLTIPITVLRCDYSKKSHTNYLFTIFHRLNTGGMRLNNQEIRNCIFAGKLNDFLKDLNTSPIWKKINRMKEDRSYRFTKQEIILRFFAFYDNLNNYQGRLAKFLNGYMEDNRNPDSETLENKKILFTRTIDIIYRKIFEGKIPTKLTTTMLEALLVGVAHNVNYIEKLPNIQIKPLYQKLQQHEEFSEQKLSEGLSGKPRVSGRLNAAKTIFSGN